MKGLLAPFTVLALAAPLAAQVPAAAGGPAAPAVRSARALLVGCTEYPYLKEAGRVPGSNTIELLGPVNDVELFARALREVYGVPDAAMTRLAGWPADPKARPTLQNIRQGFQRLAAQAQPGEWVVVYLAGHGSQQPSSSASLDDEPDGLDEIFLPADVRPAPDGAKVPNALVDDEIFELVGAIRAKGADVWLVVDACHSGTLLRGGGVRTRGLPPSALGLRGAAPRPVAGASAAPARPERTQGVAAFYGAQSFGAAPELELPEGARDAQPHGLFTYLLAAEMRRVGASATYGELIQRVIAAYQAFPCHLTIPMAQGDLDRAVGAGGRVADPPILLALRGDEIRADRGLLAGIEVGTVLAAVADGAPLDAEPVLELEVVEAGVYDARGRLRSGAVPDGATTLRARVVSRPVSDFSLALALVAPDGSARGTDDLPERVRAFLSAEGGRFRLVARAAEADWSLVVDGQHLHLRAADRIGSHDVLDVAPERLPLVLGRIRRAFGLRRACALFDAPDPSLDVWVERRPRGGAAAVRLAPGDRLVPGDELRVMLHKTGGGIVDANVYYLDASHGIQRLFPRAGGTARLEPKAEAPLEIVSWTPVIDDALGIENLWVLAVPRGPADPVLALQDLSQDPTTTRGLAVESAARGILQELLTEPRTRGIAAAGDEPVRRGSVFQVPLHTDWPPLGPPAWSAGELGRLDSPHPFLAGLPVDFEAGPCWQQSSSPAAAGRRDILLLGSPERPRAVLVDFSSPAAEGTPDAASFDPEAAFLFLDDGRRLSLYDRGDAGRFDLALLDADGDGVAEVRWTRTGAEWILQPAVRVPWLSQSHLQSSVLGPRRELATARFSVLARGSGP